MQEIVYEQVILACVTDLQGREEVALAAAVVSVSHLADWRSFFPTIKISGK